MFRVVRSGKRKSKYPSDVDVSFFLYDLLSENVGKIFAVYLSYHQYYETTHANCAFGKSVPQFAAKQWKRMITKATFVGQSFTRKPPKYERFIRPSGLRFTKAHVTHPELKCTFNLEIIGVKKNPNGPMYTSLGVMTKGSIIEVHAPP